jgi:hypothetical protein
MSRQSALPGKLRYLQPFRKKFGSKPGELNEETGETPLFQLLQKRIAGRSQSDAQKILEDDFIALREWLAQPEQQNDCLHFALDS